MFPVLFGKLQKAAVAVVTYLLRDQFTTNASAPLTTPRTCEPGPGTLTVTDTNSRISIAGSVLSISGATAANDGIVSPSSFARLAGRALLFSLPSITTITTSFRFGWADAGLSDSSVAIGGDYSSANTSIRAKTGVSVIDTLTVAGPQHDWAMVMRGTGGFLFLRTGGGSGAYTLYWVYNTDTAAQFAKLHISNTTVVFTADDMRVTDLGGSFATDNGIATAASASPIANDTLACNADCILEFTWTTPAAAGTIDLLVRRSSDSDCWIVRGDQAGSTVKLIEKVGGVETERSSVAMTWTALTAFRIVISCDTQTIKSYVANVAKNSYASASTQQTTAGAKTTQAGANFISWPRTVTING